MKDETRVCGYIYIYIHVREAIIYASMLLIHYFFLFHVFYVYILLRFIFF